MDFIKKNSKVIGVGVAGGLLGAIALYFLVNFRYYYRRNTIKEAALTESQVASVHGEE